MTVDGIDALHWQPPPPRSVGKLKTPPRRAPRVAYNLAFEERQAAAAAGLTWTEYLALPGSPAWARALEAADSKCAVVVWYRYRIALEAVKG